MNIAVKSAFASAVVVLAHACATPVEIGDEVLIANPSDFGDAGPLGGAAGDVGRGGAASGGADTGVGGSASGTGGASSGSAGAGISGMPVGMPGGGGLPGASGAGGSGAGAGGSAISAGSGGAAGTPAVAGAGGAAGVGGAGGAGGTAGTGGTGTGSAAVFDPSSCDFDDITGCEALTCQARCPTGDGGSCLNRCVPVVDCVTEEVATSPGASCVTEADPLCGGRDVGQPRACTALVDSAGGLNAAGANQPAFVARQFVECICSVPRP